MSINDLATLASLATLTLFLSPPLPSLALATPAVPRWRDTQGENKYKKSKPKTHYYSVVVALFNNVIGKKSSRGGEKTRGKAEWRGEGGERRGRERQRTFALLFSSLPPRHLPPPNQFFRPCPGSAAAPRTARASCSPPPGTRQTSRSPPPRRSSRHLARPAGSAGKTPGARPAASSPR